MKIKLSALLTGLAVLGFAAGAAASPTFTDSYWGGDAHDYGDIIGESSDFDIQGADVSKTGNALTVDVYTNFARKASKNFSVGSYSVEMGYGDLFLSTGWNPHGSDPHYTKDNSANGNHWTYALVLNDPFGNGGNATVYQLPAAEHGNNNPSVLTSDHFFRESYENKLTWRDGQGVAVDTSYSGVKAVGSGSWEVFSDYLSFTLDDISGLDLDTTNLGLGWTMYCGNDAFQVLDPDIPPDSHSVPEPGTTSLLLLGLALLGLGFARRGQSRRA